MDLVLDLLATVSRWSRSNLSEISLALVGCLLVLFGADIKGWVEQRLGSIAGALRVPLIALLCMIGSGAAHDLRHAVDRPGLEPVQQLQPGAGVVGGAGVDWRGGGSALISNTTENNCGSEPARDEAITLNINVDRYTAIASRLAPTVLLRDV